MTRKVCVRFVVASGAGLSAAAYLPAAVQGEMTRVNGVLVIPVEEDNSPRGEAEGDATVKGIGLFSTGGQMKQRFLQAVQAGVDPRGAGRVSGRDSHDDGGGDDGDLQNVQINDPLLDHITTFAPAVVRTRPFEFSTQSETSAVSDGNHVVVGYNSTANSKVEFFPGPPAFFAFTKLMFSGFSVSHDGGRKCDSGFVPSVSSDLTCEFCIPPQAFDT